MVEKGNRKSAASDSSGELAQMVERSLSMREVPGSMPGFSRSLFFFLFFANCSCDLLFGIVHLFGVAQNLSYS